MKPEELSQILTRMIKDTQEGRLDWRLDIQTTEGNEQKFTVEEEHKVWNVDECYVSYNCRYRGEDFCMITYEMIKQSDNLVKTVNYVFLPPAGVRFFSLHNLLSHSIKAEAVLVSQIHMLWMLLMNLSKEKSNHVQLKITEATMAIEEDLLKAEEGEK